MTSSVVRSVCWSWSRRATPATRSTLPRNERQALGPALDRHSATFDPRAGRAHEATSLVGAHERADPALRIHAHDIVLHQLVTVAVVRDDVAGLGHFSSSMVALTGHAEISFVPPCAIHASTAAPSVSCAASSTSFWSRPHTRERPRPCAEWAPPMGLEGCSTR